MDEELGAILPAAGYVIVTSLPGYVPIVAPRKLIVTPIGNLAFFKPEDTRYSTT
jgi:splicing factor 3B subunit 1